MTLDASKCPLLVSGYKDELMFAKLGGELLWEEDSAKLLGIRIDSSLKYAKKLLKNSQQSRECRTISQKRKGKS